MDLIIRAGFLQELWVGHDRGGGDSAAILSGGKSCLKVIQGPCCVRRLWVGERVLLYIRSQLVIQLGLCKIGKLSCECTSMGSR